MTSDDWTQTWHLFRQVRDLQPADRSVVLSRVPPHISAEVEAMIDAEEQPESEQPEPGREYGRYTLLARLGAGGMGEVFSARDRELERPVAIKFLGAKALLLPAARERMIREARSASALNHPNLVTVHEVLAVDSGVALVTELVEGQPLRVLAGTAQPIPKLITWGIQIARALAVAHEHAIVHSDIKPENIMLRPDGYIKILDFGLAQSIGITAGIEELPLGTIGYMSPEQIRGAALTGASDVFSLGVVLIELATGRHPFLGGTLSATTLAIAHREVEYTAPEIPGGSQFTALVRAMLQKDPSARPAMVEVSDRLERAVVSRSRNLPGYWIAAACALVAFFAFAWFRNRGPKPPQLSAPVAITNYEGLEDQPAFSPNGNRLAFVWSGAGGSQPDLYIRSADALDDSPRQVTNDSNEEFSPVWSPDGKYLAWRRRQYNGVGELRVAAINGLVAGPARTVATTVNDGGFHGLAWTPDSTSLISRDISEPSSQHEFPLYRIRIADGSKTPLTGEPQMQDFQPVVSPDGRRLLFLRYNISRPQVCYADFGPELLKPICQTINALPEAATWTLDSRGILLYSGNALWLFSADGSSDGRPDKLREGNFSHLTTDATGKRYAFDRTVTDANILQLDVHTRRISRLISSSEEDSEPQFSPDGTRILFRSSRTGHFELYTSNPDGTGLRQLTHLLSHCGSARWSPDGKWIAYDSVQDFPGPSGVRKFDNIYVMSSEGGLARRLTDDRADSIVPNWSADSRWIYYSGDLGTHKVQREGGPAVQVAPFSMFGAVESSDGKWLWYEKPKTGKGLWRRRVAGGSEELIPGTENLTYRTWECRGNRLVFLLSGPEPGFWMSHIEDDRISPARFIGPAPGKPLLGPATMSISPDAKTILYTEEDLTLGDIYTFGLINPAR